MWRALIVLATVLVVVDATGFLSHCDDSCVDELSGKQCPPACPTCACTPHAMSSMPAPERVVVVASLTEHLIELPAPAVVAGQLAPPPHVRPPIA